MSYVAAVDADEYLNPDLFGFLVEENIESLVMALAAHGIVGR